MYTKVSKAPGLNIGEVLASRGGRRMRTHRGVNQVQGYCDDIEAKGRYTVAKMCNAEN